MTKLISIALITALMYKPMMGLYLVVDFEIHRDYVAEYLCKNRDNTAMNCQGKCYLMEKLSKKLDDDTNEHHRLLNQLTKTEVMFVHVVPVIHFTKAVKKIFLEQMPHLSTRHFISDIFHPPLF